MVNGIQAWVIPDPTISVGEDYVTSNKYINIYTWKYETEITRKKHFVIGIGIKNVLRIINANDRWICFSLLK